MEENVLNKIIVFDVWAEYAHFRKFYTTTSPLTFSVPPRTAVCGLIGAITGLSKEENDYLKYFPFEGAKIGLRILNPIKKTIVAQNLIHTKNAKGPGMNLITQRTQIRFEFLKSPKYRIYFAYTGENGNLLNLKQLLSEHKSVYTPVLGLSENIANFEFIGEFEIEHLHSNDFIAVNSVIPLGQVEEENGLNFNYNAEYFSERQPLMLDNERVVQKYDEILFERNGLPVNVRLKNGHFEIAGEGKEKIVFIE